MTSSPQLQRSFRMEKITPDNYRYPLPVARGYTVLQNGLKA